MSQTQAFIHSRQYVWVCTLDCQIWTHFALASTNVVSKARARVSNSGPFESPSNGLSCVYEFEILIGALMGQNPLKCEPVNLSKKNLLIENTWQISEQKNWIS